MRISKSQLRKIIQEETSRLREAPMMPRETFYDDKVSYLSQALNHLDNAIDMLQQVSAMDLETPVGDDPDVQSATMDLQSAKEFIEGILSAVEVLADSSGVA